MTAGEQLSLRPLDLDLAAAYLAMVDEHIACGEGYPYNNIPLARQDFAAFAQELADEARGIGLPPGITPQQTYVLVRDGNTVLGEFRLRPSLPEPYAEQNGHIGYNIRPSERRRGYATRGLALLLQEARRLGVRGVMLTVEGQNPGSARAIERNGGRLAQQLTKPKTGATIDCYWIALEGDGWLQPSHPSASSSDQRRHD